MRECVVKHLIGSISCSLLSVAISYTQVEQAVRLTGEVMALAVSTVLFFQAIRKKK